MADKYLLDYAVTGTPYLKGIVFRKEEIIEGNRKKIDSSCGDANMKCIFFTISGSSAKF